MTIENPRATIKAIWRYLAKADGYQPFGHDWPTLRLTHPQVAAVLREAMAMDAAEVAR